MTKPPPATNDGAASELDELDGLIAEAWRSQYGQPVHGREVAERVVVRARALGDRRRESLARLSLACYQMRHGDSRLAEQEFRELKTFFEESADQTGLMRASFGVSALLGRNGKPEESYAELVCYTAQLDEADDVDVLMIHNALGVCSVDAGLPDEGMRHFYRALRAARRLGSADHLALILSNLGDAQHGAGNYEDAIRFLIEADTVVTQAGLASMAPMVASNLAMCQLAIGAHEAAYDTIAPFLKMSAGLVRIGRSDTAFFQAIAAHTFTAHSEWQRARAMVELALHSAEAAGEAKVMTHCYWVLGLVERGCGHLQAALAALQQAEARLSTLRDPYYLLQIPRELARTHAALGQWREAYEHQERFQQHYQHLQGSAARARAQIMQISSELSEAERERDSALIKQAEAEQARAELEMFNHELAAKVDEIERLQDKLREQAIRDPLTELYNRRYLNDALSSELQLADRRAYPLCVVLIDVDHFKQVNDRYGHPVGDRALIALAALLRANIRGSDFACRFGGEEFCLVLSDIDQAQAMQRAETLLAAFNVMTVEVEDGVLSGLTFSGGVAEYTRDGYTVDALLMAADDALYRAKAAGRNRVLAAS